MFRSRTKPSAKTSSNQGTEDQDEQEEQEFHVKVLEDQLLSPVVSTRPGDQDDYTDDRNDDDINDHYNHNYSHGNTEQQRVQKVLDRMVDASVGSPTSPSAPYTSTTMMSTTGRVFTASKTRTTRTGSSSSHSSSGAGGRSAMAISADIIEVDQQAQQRERGQSLTNGGNSSDSLAVASGHGMVRASNPASLSVETGSSAPAKSSLLTGFGSVFSSSSNNSTDGNKNNTRGGANNSGGVVARTVEIVELSPGPGSPSRPRFGGSNGIGARSHGSLNKMGGAAKGGVNRDSGGGSVSMGNLPQAGGGSSHQESKRSTTTTTSTTAAAYPTSTSGAMPGAGGGSGSSKSSHRRGSISNQQQHRQENGAVLSPTVLVWNANSNSNNNHTHIYNHHNHNNNSHHQQHHHHQASRNGFGQSWVQGVSRAVDAAADSIGMSMEPQPLPSKFGQRRAIADNQNQQQHEHPQHFHQRQHRQSERYQHGSDTVVDDEDEYLGQHDGDSKRRRGGGTSFGSGNGSTNVFGRGVQWIKIALMSFTGDLNSKAGGISTSTSSKGKRNGGTRYRAGPSLRSPLSCIPLKLRLVFVFFLAASVTYTTLYFCWVVLSEVAIVAGISGGVDKESSGHGHKHHGADHKSATYAARKGLQYTAQELLLRRRKAVAARKLSVFDVEAMNYSIFQWELKTKDNENAISTNLISEDYMLAKSFSDAMFPSKVLPFYFKASESFPKDQITITTLITPDRYGIFKRLVHQYRGPISVATHIRGDNDTERDAHFTALHELFGSSPELRRYVDLHVIVDSIDLQLNMWRNVGRLFARTDYFMMLDVDFHIPPGFKRRLHSSRQARDLLKNGAALVIPAFEYNLEDDPKDSVYFPETKTELLPMVAKGQIRVFHDFFPPGHNSTDYPKWYGMHGYRMKTEDKPVPHGQPPSRPEWDPDHPLNQGKGFDSAFAAAEEIEAREMEAAEAAANAGKGARYGLDNDNDSPTPASGPYTSLTELSKALAQQVPYKVTTFHPRYEPYIIVKREGTPWCDERFVGYGGNKAACLFEIFVSGVEFWVMPQDFLIHQYHDYPTNSRKAGRILNRQLFVQFQQEICYRYFQTFLETGDWYTDKAKNLRDQCRGFEGFLESADQLAREYEKRHPGTLKRKRRKRRRITPLPVPVMGEETKVANSARDTFGWIENSFNQNDQQQQEQQEHAPPAELVGEATKEPSNFWFDMNKNSLQGQVHPLPVPPLSSPDSPLSHPQDYLGELIQQGHAPPPNPPPVARVNLLTGSIFDPDQQQHRARKPPHWDEDIDHQLGLGYRDEEDDLDESEFLGSVGQVDAQIGNLDDDDDDDDDADKDDKPDADGFVPVREEYDEPTSEFDDPDFEYVDIVDQLDHVHSHQSANLALLHHDHPKYGPVVVRNYYTPPPPVDLDEFGLPIVYVPVPVVVPAATTTPTTLTAPVEASSAFGGEPAVTTEAPAHPMAATIEVPVVNNIPNRVLLHRDHL